MLFNPLLLISSISISIKVSSKFNRVAFWYASSNFSSVSSHSVEMLTTPSIYFPSLYPILLRICKSLAVFLSYFSTKNRQKTTSAIVDKCGFLVSAFYLTSTQPFLMATTTAWVRSFTFIFCKILLTWFLTVFSLMNSASPMPLLLFPSASS